MSLRDLPSMTALRAFEAAARHQSFRAAADELHVTHSAVSHQIKELERRLGVPLFWRRGRGVELTEAGALYFPILRDAFDRMAQGADLVRDTSFAGDLTVQVYVTVAVRWLIPRLHRFQERNPDIFVRLSTSHADWEFDPDNVDVGIIYVRRRAGTEWHRTHLFDAPIFPVCSPALLNGPRPLRTPGDLAAHTLLHVYTARDDWKAWLAQAGVPELAGREGPKFDSYLLAIEAAADGQGVAICSGFLVTGDLKSGRLVRPFDLEVPQPGGWYLICRKERAGDRRIARFRDWLCAEIAADETINGPGRDLDDRAVRVPQPSG